MEGTETRWRRGCCLETHEPCAGPLTDFRDGEQRKYHNFCTSAWMASEDGSELGLTWSRPDAVQWAEAYSAIFPNCQLLIESHAKAQEVVTEHEVLDSQR